MRILYDHQVFSLQDSGGISRYHYELARALQGFDQVRVEVFMGRNRSVFPFLDLRGPRTKVTASSSSRTKPGYARYLLNEASLSLAAPFRGAFDVYHPTLNRIMPAVRRRRLVMTQHDCTHERFPHLFRNTEAYIRAKRRILSRADSILCVSASSRRDLLEFYDLDERKAHVVHHGFSPLQEDTGSAEPSVPSTPYLLYVGSRTGYKNFMLLLEAFAMSDLGQDYRLVAVGGGPASAVENLRLSRLGIGHRVDLVPRAGDWALAAFYRNASLFVYPSLYEGFGFPPLEAMSLGCPVLANRTSALPEICGEAAFYFRSQNPQSHEDASQLAEVLAATLNDSAGLLAKRRLGYEQVKLYDWSNTARRTLEVYAGCG